MNKYLRKILILLIALPIVTYCLAIIFIIVSDKVGGNTHGKYILLRIFSFSFFYFKVVGITAVSFPESSPIKNRILRAT